MIDFDLLHQEHKEKTARNRESSPKILDLHGINYESKNGGAHLVIRYRDFIADFWPGTGKYIVRGTGEYKRGVRNLVKDLDRYKDTI